MGSAFKLAVSLICVAALAGCSARASSFYRNPSGENATALCRTVYDEGKGMQFRRDAAMELMRRGIDDEQCRERITDQNILIGTIAIIAGVTAVGVACANNACPRVGGFAGAGIGPDIDCAGGPGDGPRFQPGPVWVGSDDPFDLDRDGDGWGCEVGGDFGA